MNFKSTILFLSYLLLCFSVVFAQNEQAHTDLQKYIEEYNIPVMTTDYGLHYHLTHTGTGVKPKVGDYVAINFKGKLLDGTVFEQSAPNEPFIFQVGYRQVIRGWDLGLREFPVGSKGNLYIPPNLGYGTRGAGKLVPPNTALIFEIELLKLLSEQEYDEYMTAIEAKEAAAYKEKIEQQFLKDKKIIQDYALNKKLRTKRTNSGLSYVITKKGKGPTAQKGNNLQVSYEGFLVDGTPFDATKSKAPYKFPLGRNKVIKGWEEGLTYFSEGSEGILLIPSKLAYGPRGIYEKNIAIPANSVLIFKIKVEKIN